MPLTLSGGIGVSAVEKVELSGSQGTTELVFGRVNHLRAPVKNLQGVSFSPVKGFTIQKSTI